MKKRYRVIEIVRHTYVYEVEAKSKKEAEDNVKKGIFNNSREQDSKTRVYSAPLEPTYEAFEAKEI